MKKSKEEYNTKWIEINQQIQKLNRERRELYDEYVMENLQLCVDEYIKKYNFADDTNPWRIIQSPNIQYYPLSGGFYKWHCERITCDKPVSSRHLVFMTYLNDVDDEGETEFFHQNLKIKPEAGSVIIFPSKTLHLVHPIADNFRYTVAVLAYNKDMNN